ncbi:hypothetical protein B5C26_00020 [Photorhabdus luminescens]|uniref:hypothetical protein n=1 Tax=Photorhabdus luminescens TaxID=29488 RepID=UPI000B4D580C|nr:hypothetical protein [Photorhabdus luminescens]OWO87203.1 hypothetical protein B5C26_00020 [Photorhabdus luminescens]
MEQEELNVINFGIKYDGDTENGPLNHQIDARLLGTSMVSLCDLIEQSNKIINGESSEIHIDVRAHKEGSFELLLSIAQDMSNVDVLDVIGLTKTAATGATIGSLFGVIKWLKGRKVADSEYDADTDTYSLITKDNEKIECTETVKKLISSDIVMRGVNDIVYAPLTDDEISSVTFIKDDLPLEIIEKTEKNVFQLSRSPIKSEKDSETHTSEVHITSVNFTKKTGWKMMLHNGEEVSISMNDAAFIERINLNKASFSKDDLFQVKYTKTQTKTDGVLVGNPRYSIEQVMRHRAANDRKIV